MSRAGYVLVGGKSSRLGRDKAYLDHGGRPLVLATAEKVREAAGAVTLVGSPERYAHLGPRTIADAAADRGPLAGLVAALDDTAARWNLVVACDMPGLSAGFLRFLFEVAEVSGCEAVVPMQPDGRDQPLCAVYAKSLAERFRRALAGERCKLTSALAGAAVRRLLPPEYDSFGRDGGLFANVNRPEDLRWLSGGPPGPS